MDSKSNWVEGFKRISWEPEILISGGILFTLYKAKTTLVLVHNQFYPLSLHGFKIILIFLTLSISALTVGFTLHLITKSFWIALLAIKSVFPQGIDKKKIKYAEYFWQKTNIDLTLDAKINAVGNASSLLFTISFLALFLVLGVLTYLIMWFIIGRFVYDFLPFPMEILVFVPIILPFIDFITLGGLKKHPFIAKVYLPNYKFISWITFSFLYREVLYSLISNATKKSIILFSIVFMFFSVVLTIWNSSDFMINSTNSNNWAFFKPKLSTSINERLYENLRSTSDQVAIATIQSDVIIDNHIKLYLRYRNNMDWELDSLANEHPSLVSNQLLNKYIEVKIDQEEIDSIKWFYTMRQDINQPGLIGYIPITNLATGSHAVNLRVITHQGEYTIPFWKE